MNKDRFKFRVWENNTRNCYLKDEKTAIVGDGDLIYGDTITNAMQLAYGEDNPNIIVEQSTGLRDKNGNLIYEGDILSCDLKDVEGATGEEIHYKKQGVVQRDKNGKYFIGGQDWYGSDITFYNECAEIIGNIHEKAE